MIQAQPSLGSDSRLFAYLNTQSNIEESNDNTEESASVYSSKNDYTQESVPVYSSSNNGGIWRVMAMNVNTVVSASYDHLAKIWTARRGSSEWELTESKVLSKHSREVLSLARFNESIFLTGSSDGRLCFWNCEDGSFVDSIKEQQRSKGFYSVAVIDTGAVATGACNMPKRHRGEWNHTIKVWDVAHKKLRSELFGHEGGISALVPIHGNRIVSASGDSTVRVWDLSSQSAVSIFKRHTDYVYGLAKYGEESVISGSRDRTMRLLDLSTEKEVGQFIDSDGIAHSSTIYDVKVSDSNVVASASRDGYVKIWDPKTLTCIKIVDPEDGFVYGVDFSSDGKIFAGTAGKAEEKVVKEKKSKQHQHNAHVVMWEFRSL